MKQIMILLIFIFVVTQPTSAEPISGKHLFVGAENSLFRLSPNGKIISQFYRGEEGRYISFIDRENSKFVDSSRVIGQRFVDNYTWLNNEYLYFHANRNSYDYEMIASFDGEKLSFVDVGQFGYLVDSLDHSPDFVLFAKKQRHEKYYKLYQIAISDLFEKNFSKATKLDVSTSLSRSFFYDGRSDSIMAIEVDLEAEKAYIKKAPYTGGDWETVLVIEDLEHEFNPQGFINDSTLAVLTNRETDKVVLQEFNIQTQTLGKVIFQHENYDLLDASIDKNGEISFVTFKEHGVTRYHYFKLKNSPIVQAIESKFKNKNYTFIDFSSDAEYGVVYVNASNNPGEYYLYTAKNNELKKIMSSIPSLDGMKFSSTEKFKVKSDDGLIIEALFNPATTYDHKTLIVMPHGGPISVQDNDYFNPRVQYYTSRGFSVLRVNFRGSGGYGKDFQKKGVGEWGKRIESDISSALEHLRSKKHFDNICAMGVSYGGYSATMLAIENPEIYQCVVGAFGVYDLKLAFNGSNIRASKEYRKLVSNTIGEYSDQMLEVSPVYQHGKLKAPILLLAGTRDDIADFEHTNRFNYVLKRNNHPVESIFYQGQKHGHSTWWGDQHQAAITYDFMIRALGLNFPKVDKLNEKAKNAIADDFVIIADGFEFKNSVPDDDIKAHEFYIKAANYDHQRSAFNAGANYHNASGIEMDMEKAAQYYLQASELGYVDATSRLARMYMEGEHFEVDWTRAKTLFEKAHEQEKSPITAIKLARLNCAAPKEIRNFSQCLELLNYAVFDKHKDADHKNIRDALETAMAGIYFDGNHSTDEMLELKSFMKKAFKLSDFILEIDDVEAGFFAFIESEKFGYRGEFEHIELTEFQDYPSKTIDFGVTFSVDQAGINKFSDNVAIVMRWTVTDSQGNVTYPVHTVLYGNHEDNFVIRRDYSFIENGDIWKLEIMDLDKNVLFEKEYKKVNSTEVMTL